MSSRLGTNKMYKPVGKGYGKPYVWLPRSKIAIFKAMFTRITGILGTKGEAREYIGLSDAALDRLERGKLSCIDGRKILNAYNNVRIKSK